MLSNDPSNKRGDSEEATRREEGRRIRAEIFGEAALAKGRGPTDDLAPDLARLSDEILWGVIWARPGIDLRTKSLCTIVCLLALERYPFVRAHLDGARNLGITRDEITAAMVHLTFYVGLPVVHSGLALVAEVYGDGASASE